MIGRLAKYLLKSSKGAGATFIASSIIHKAAVMGAGFVALRWVAPADAGAWQFALLVEQILYVFRLGVPNAVNRQVPLLLGRKDPDSAAAAFQVGASYMLLCGGLLVLTIAGFLLLSRELVGSQTIAFLGLAFIAPCNLISNIYEGVLRGQKALRKLSYTYFILVPSGALTLLLPMQWGFKGYVLRLVILGALQLLLFVLSASIPFKLRFGASGIFELMRLGFPLFIWNYLSSLSATILPWFITYYGGLTFLGLWGPANSLLALISLVPAAFGAYLGPALNYAQGQGKKAVDLLRTLKRGFLMALAITTAASVVFAVVGAKFVQHWMPAYSAVSDSFWLIAAIGCVRCYVVIQTALGLFVDWWLVRNNLMALWAIRLTMVAALWLSGKPTFNQICGGLLAGESVYLALQWWQLKKYLLRKIA